MELLRRFLCYLFPSLYDCKALQNDSVPIIQTSTKAEKAKTATSQKLACDSDHSLMDQVPVNDEEMMSPNSVISVEKTQTVTTPKLTIELNHSFKAGAPGYTGEMKFRFSDSERSEKTKEILESFREKLKRGPDPLRFLEAIKEYSELGIGLSGPEAFEIPFDANMKETYVWISLMNYSTCENCSKQHGKVKSLNSWSNIGEPRCGNCATEHLCNCILFPAFKVDENIQKNIDALGDNFKKKKSIMKKAKSSLDTDDLKTFLIAVDEGFPINYYDTKEMAYLIHLAVQGGCKKIVSNLVNRDFDYRCVDGYGLSALNYAFNGNDIQLLKILIEKQVPFGKPLSSDQLSKRFRKKDENSKRQEIITFLRDEGYIKE